LKIREDFSCRKNLGRWYMLTSMLNS